MSPVIQQIGKVNNTAIANSHILMHVTAYKIYDDSIKNKQKKNPLSSLSFKPLPKSSYYEGMEVLQCLPFQKITLPFLTIQFILLFFTLYLLLIPEHSYTIGWIPNLFVYNFHCVSSWRSPSTSLFNVSARHQWWAYMHDSLQLRFWAARTVRRADEGAHLPRGTRI